MFAIRKKMTQATAAGAMSIDMEMANAYSRKRTGDE